MVKRQIKVTDSLNEAANVMSVRDRQKISTDGLFIFSTRTLTMTSFLLCGIHPNQD